MTTANDLLRQGVDVLMRQHACTREQAKARAQILVAADAETVSMRESPAPLAGTLSEKTKAILMASPRLSFSEAQSRASKTMSWKQVRGRP